MNNISNDRVRVYGLDILKALCAFLVVVIHAPFPGKVGSYLVALSRIAVPIFFMITGYFYTDTQNRKRELESIKKILILCLFSNVLYFLWGLFIGILRGEVKQYFFQMFTWKSLLNFFIFNESPFASHLWYLSAILYVLIFVYLLNKIFPKYFSKILLIATPFLLLTDLIFGKYSLLLFQREYPYIFVRNFLCVGIPYFTVGYYLRKHREDIEEFIQKRFLLVSLILIFTFTTILEKYLLNHFEVSATREHYISTTFLSIFVFLIFTRNYWNGKMSFLYGVGRSYSSYIYIVHPIIIMVLDIIVRRLPIHNFYMYCRPFAVFFVSLLICILYIKIRTVFSNKCRKRSPI